MKSRLALVVVLGALAGVFSAPVVHARAETPILEKHAPNSDFGGFDQAQYVPDAHFMWFVMGQLQHDADIDVVTFDYEAGNTMRGVIFIPVNDDLHNFSPNVALVGPGLPMPDEELPFALPAGMGAVVARSNSNKTYFDIFTQINFYPRATVEAVAPVTGRYYMVVFGKPVGSARYALDIGIMETFAPDVLARYPINWWEVRDFTRWGHWPAILYTAGTAGALHLLLRRGGLRRRTSDLTRSVISIISVFAIAITAMGVVVQEALYRDLALNATGILLVIATVALGGITIAAAHMLTALRERFSPRELAPQGLFRTVDGHELHYTDEGPRDGRLLLLLHGFSSSVFTWRNARRALADAGYRVIALDLLGSGASARPNGLVYDTQNQARLVAAFMRNLGLDQAHLIGHSFGGRLAMQLALIAPERVKSLALIAPEAFATRRPAVAKVVAMPVIGYPLTFYSTSPLLVRAGLAYVSYDKAWLTPDAVKGYAAPLYVKGSVRAQIAQSRSPKDAGDLSVPGNASRIAQPTLLLWGERDPIFPASDGERLAAQMPLARLTVIRNAGHVLHEENPEATLDALLAWLRDAA